MTCDQDISRVSFDASRPVGKSFLYYWAFLHCRTKEEVIHTIFDLLQRNGGVTLKAALEGNPRVNAYILALSSRQPFWVDRLLTIPELHSGWSVRCNEDENGEKNEAPVFPLFRGLSMGLIPDATIAQIVPHSNDPALNASRYHETRQVTAFHVAILNGYPQTLYAILLRPGLEMNSPPMPSFVRHSILFGGTQKQTAITHAFDQAQLAFADLPTMLSNVLFTAIGLALSIPLCNIVAQYYRMPYPVRKCKTLIAEQSSTDPKEETPEGSHKTKPGNENVGAPAAPKDILHPLLMPDDF